MTRRSWVLVALAVLAVVVGGWLSMRPPASPEPPRANGSTCPIASLPHEALDTVRRIHTAGPFPFPRSDGAVFGNNERHLPAQRRGYYHEYTVITPRARDRSMRRIVTGGTPLTDPPQYFYTGNHYDTFCLISGAGRS